MIPKPVEDSPTRAERLLMQFPKRLWVVLVVVLLGLQFLSIGGYRIAGRLNDARFIQSDNTTWLLVQTEVEALKLELALYRAKDQLLHMEWGEVEADALRQALDIYLSRIARVDSYLQAQAGLDGLRAGENWRNIASAADALSNRLDQPDDFLPENVGPALDLAFAQRGLVRQFVIDGLRYQASRSMDEREALTNLLLRSALVAVALIGFLMLTSWAMLKLSRRMEQLFARANRMSANLEHTLDATLEGVIVSSPDGRIRNVNATALDIFGLSQEAMLAADFFELLEPFREPPRKGGSRGAAHLVRDMRELLKSVRAEEAASGNRRTELEIRRPDGTPMPVEVSLAFARDTDDRPVWFAFIRDISDRWSHEQSLRAARDTAVELAEAKSRFLAVMSHEMRTPLNGLIAALDLLRNSPPLSERQLRFLDVAERSAGLALAQINDVLELARLESGGLLEPDEVFNLRQLIRGISDQVAPLAQLRDNRIILDLPAEEEAWLIGARRGLIRVTMNLVGNALKFTSSGSIRIRASLTPAGTEDEQMRLEVEVADSGIGIEAARLADIFDAFGGMNTGYTRETGGTGLGLGIVSRTISRMGGRVSVDSQPGQGSVFRFEVPLRRAQVPGQSAEQMTDAGARLAQCDILIAEDNETNRLVLREMLLHMGQRVDEAANGQEAVERASMKSYALILMDVSMPVLDGLAATRSIRAGAGPSAGARIVALTAHSQPEEVKQFHSVGLDEVLSKPVTMLALSAMLARHIDTVAPESLALPQSGHQPGPIDPVVFGELEILLPPETLLALLGDLRRETRMLYDVLRMRQDCTNDSYLAAETHRLQGACAMIGARTLSLKLQAVVNALKLSDTPAFAAAAIPALIEWRAVSAALDAFEERFSSRLTDATKLPGVTRH